MPHLLALDQGTTSSRAIVFDGSGSAQEIAQREFTQHFPRPGWVEHDPAEIWDSQLATARDVLGRGAAVEAIGITNQRETVVVWDRATGTPVHNAIVWQDRRTSARCDALRRDGAADLISRKTGLEVDAYFSGTKIEWILDNVNGARPRAERGELCAGTIDSWLVWNLTGGAVHATDASNASRTMLLDIHSGEWDPELCDLLRVPIGILPEVRDSSGSFGRTDASLGLGDLEILGVLGDQQAALAGQACLEPGMAKNTYGTGCFMLMNTGPEARCSSNRLLTTIAWRLGGRIDYALEGSVFIGGAAVQWLRDGLGIIENAPQIEALASSVDDSGGVHVVPAFVGLGAPYWDQDARGTIVGITRGTSAAHIARATLEGIAHQVCDLHEAMTNDAGSATSELRVDGGASANDLLMQMQADLLQAPLVRPRVTETTALGAAFAAGMAAGVWESNAEVEAIWAADARFEPRMSADDARAARASWKRAVERSRGWAVES